MSDWRRTLEKVEAEYVGRVAPNLTRQQARALKRTIARIEASEEKAARRKQKRGAK